MRNRIRMFFNFFAFNLLFFALYLNFIYEDAAAAVPVPLTVEKIEIQPLPLPAMIAPLVNEKATVEKTRKKMVVVEKENQALKLSMN